MNRRIAAAAAAAVAIAALIALTLGAATASAGWKLGMTIHNKTPYTLVYRRTEARNVDAWIQAPDKPRDAMVIRPNSDSVRIEYLYDWPGSDTWARVMWTIENDQPRALGELGYAVRVECPNSCGIDYYRSTTGTLFNRKLAEFDNLRIEWSDNGSKPAYGYFGELTLSLKSRGVLAPPPPPPVLGSCARPGRGRGAPRVETENLRCKGALRALEAGAVERGRWATRGWECAKASGRGVRGSIRCERDGSAFTFKPDA